MPLANSSRAGAGREHAGRSAKTAQPFQPDRAVLRQAAREPRDLPPVRIGRAEHLFRQRRAVAGAEQLRADRIGPQHKFAVGRPQPCGVGARRVHRKPGIAEPLHLEIRTNHRTFDRTAWAFPRQRLQVRPSNDDSLNHPLVSQAEGGRSTASAARAAQSRDNVNLDEQSSLLPR
jgi:hypothetical protein